MTVGSTIYPLHPGCAIMFRSATEYTWHLDEKGVSYIAINFDYTMNFSHIQKSFHPIHAENFSENSNLEKVEFEDAQILNAPIYIETATQLEANLRLIASEFYLKNEYTSELLSTCLKFIIINIVRLCSAQENPDRKRSYDIVRRVIQYIENNYKENLSNENLGEYFHFNSSHLNRIFKQNTGDTLHNFLVRYRMNLAMDLLHTSNLSVSEIVSSVGFSDVPHFIKSFKKITGKTPGEYRNSIQKAE